LKIDDVTFGFSINAKVKDGGTALHSAAREGRIECVQVLLAAGIGYCDAVQFDNYSSVIRYSVFAILGALFLFKFLSLAYPALLRLFDCTQAHVGGAFS
jgi:hypothetical protein